MENKIGFIGTGNMGSALVKGIINSGNFNKNNIFLFDTDMKKLIATAEELGVKHTKSVLDLIKECDVIIFAVKPHIVPIVLNDIKDVWASKKIAISIAAGVEIATYESFLGKGAIIVRTMPNTPALVSEGMTIIAPGKNVDENTLKYTKEIMACVGKFVVVEEKDVNKLTAITGSSPAYVYMFIEAMADAAVKLGIKKDLAVQLSAQAVYGSAKMVLETGRHPAQLRDDVCSPGGTTIEAVASLEKNGLRNTIIEAITVCAEKADKLSGKKNEKN